MKTVVRYFLSLIVCFLCSIDSSQSAGRFAEENLVVNLTSGRVPSARPVPNPTDAINVSLDFSLHSVVNINEISGTMRTRLVIKIEWNDFSLAWDPTSFQNIDSIQMMKGDIWTPDLTIYNAMTSSTELEKEDFMVTVTSDGKVRWLPGLLLDTSCQISVAKFPFDTQMCQIIIRPMFRDTRTQIMSAIFKQTNIAQNTAWILTKREMVCETYDVVYQTCSYKLYLSRRPSYNILHMLCPVVLLSFMKGFVFLLPSSSGEKVTFCISIFLTFSVILDSIQSALPATSLESSYFAVFVFFQFCLCGIESCVSVLIVRLNCRSSDDKVPTYLKNLCHSLRIVPKLSSITVVSPVNIRQSENNGVTHINDTNKHGDDIDSTGRISFEQVATGLDKFCVYLFSVLSVVSYVVLFIILFV